MPIDPSIPLSVQQFKPASIPDLLSLKDLSTRSQANQIALANAAKDQEERTNIGKILQAPQSIDPTTGRLSLGAIEAVTRIKPEMGFELQRQQEQLRLSDLNRSKEKQGVLAQIGASYVSAFDRALQTTGGNRQEAERLAREQAITAIDEKDRSGGLVGFDEQEKARLRNLPDPDKMRTIVTSMGGRIPEPAESPFQKELAGAGILPGSPEYTKKMKQKVEKDVAPTPSMISLTGTGKLGEDALTLGVDQYLAGDTSAAQGYSRNAAMKAQFMNRLAARAKELGMSGKDIAAKTAEFRGIQAGERTLGTRSANVEMAVNEASQFADLSLKASEDFKRTGFVPLNKAVNLAASTKDPKYSRFVAANTSFINAYARAISPSGVPTQSDKEHAREMINTAQTHEQYSAVIDQLQKEMKAAVRAPAIVRESLREAATGKKSEELKGTSWNDDKERRYQELLRKRSAAQ